MAKASVTEKPSQETVLETKQAAQNVFIDFDSELAKINKKINEIKNSKKGNASVQKKREKEIVKLEKEIVKLECLRDLSVGDLVTIKNSKDNCLGQIIDIINGNLLEYLIAWEGSVTPTPSSYEVVQKIDPDLVAWEWKDGKEPKLSRKFDDLECNSLIVIEKKLGEYSKKRTEIAKARTSYLVELWNALTKEIFSKDDLVRYEGKIYLVVGHDTPEKSKLLYCQVQPYAQETISEEDTKVTTSKIFLASPSQLEVLNVAQKFLNIAAVRKYPCQMQLLISEITLDDKLQQRVKYDKGAIADYQENLAEMPPVKVVLDDQGIYWLWDGFHTILSCKAKEKLVVTADVEKGTFDDAFLNSLGANNARGVRRTRADRERAILQALAAREAGTLLTEEGKRPSNRWIAKIIGGVHRTTIDNFYNQIYGEKAKKTKTKQQELNLETSGDSSTTTQQQQATKTGKANLKTTEDDQQALQDSEPTTRDLPDTGAEVESITQTTETQTTFDDSFVDVTQATEREQIKYKEGELVYIRNDASDPRLKNLQRQHALIQETGENTVAIRLWTGNIIDNLGKVNIAKISGSIPSLIKVDQDVYTQLMLSCDSWEAATKLINQLLRQAFAPVKTTKDAESTPKLKQVSGKK